MLVRTSTANASIAMPFWTTPQVVVRLLLLLIGVCLPISLSQAGAMSGYVYTRALVTNENGNLIWGEYDPETGKYLSDLAEATGDWDPVQWRVMSGNEYRSYEDQYKALTQQYEDLGALLSRVEYESQTLLLADGQTPVATKPALRGGTAYVAILPQARRLIDDPDSLILAEFPVNPSQVSAVSSSTLSMLVKYAGSGLGEIKAVTNNRIGFKAAFLQDKEGQAIPVAEGIFEEGFRLKRWEGESVLGPVSGVRVESPFFAQGVTDSEGFYNMHWYSIPCPLLYYSLDGFMTAWLRYQRFNPKARSAGGRGVYILQRSVSESCVPNVYFVPFFGPMPLGAGSVSTYPSNANFPVDVMVLSGTAHLSDGVGGRIPIGDITQFQAESPDNSLTATTGYDFDDDGTADTIQAGRFETNEAGEKVFVAGTDGVAPAQQLQGVWFSGGGKTPGQDLPDLTRVMDSTSFAGLTHQGLLAQVAAEDLRNSDIYVVRVSDGKLIAERIGLNEYEADRISDFGEDADNSQFFYTMQMRNSLGDAFRYTYRYQIIGRDFDLWQADSGINPELHQRLSDHLQPGDLIRIYAINRATGYIGHTDTVMQQAGTMGGGELSFHIDPIVMGPPNLKVRVERDYKIQAGLEKGEIREDQIIGFEGASLTSDTAVKITTEWLDRDGRPMPEALSGAGYTGRVAILSGDKTLPNDNQGVYQFAIEPGEHLQVLQLPNAVASDNQHYYLHISGEPESGNPIFQGTSNQRTREADFTSTGQNPGILAKRPNEYVPFLVPVFDEETTELQRQAYRQIKRDNSELGETLEKPEPIYRWVYRPEMQFSSYQLKMDEIKLSQDENGDGQFQDNESINLLANDKPVITSGGILSLLYNMNTTDLLPLDYFNAGENKELIFALGEQEVKATLGEDQTLQFEDLSQLVSLDPDDLLTLRLYANNDMGNVLWEWAFEHLVLDTQLADYDSSSGETLYVSADAPVVPLQALLVGYANRDPATKEPVVAKWSATGGATLGTTTETNEDLGVFFNEVTLPTAAESQSRVSVELVGVQDSKSTLPMIEVVPGVAKQISYSQSGNVSVGGYGRATLTFTAKDQFGNTLSDGSGVSFFVGNSLEVVSADGATTNGQATVVVKGSSHSGPATVRFEVGEISETVNLEVRPLTVEIALDATVVAGDSKTLEVNVTDFEGNPVSGVDLQLGSTYGYLLEKELTTDSNGQAVTTYTAPHSRGSGVVTAQVERTALTEKAVEVVYLSLADQDLEVDNATVIGDVTTAGAITHTRYDATPIDVAYPVTRTIKALGSDGDNVTITLGDIRDPNLSPLVAYFMNSVYQNQVEDDTGFHALHASYVTRANGTWLGGGHSLNFNRDNDLTEAGDQPSRLWVDNVTRLQQGGDLGFSLEFFPRGDGGGTLVDLGQGAQRLTLNTSNQLQYQVRTGNGVVSVTSATLFPGRWYQVAVRYTNNQVELWVNGVSYTAAHSGAIEYQWTANSGDLLLDASAPHDLLIGEGFNGQLNSLKWYNWAAQPVLAFADGTTEKTVTIGTEGFVDLTIQSTGRLQESGSQIPLLRVAIHTDKVRQYASLLSTESFQQMAGQYVDTLATDTPAINVAALSNPLNTAYTANGYINFSLFSQAHAAESSSFLWDLVNWVIPLESFGIIFEQLGYLVTDPDKFEADEFIIALVDAITIFPPAKGLKLFVVPLRAMTRALKAVNPKFMKFFGGALNRVMQKAKKGELDTLWNMLPFLVLAAEIYMDEELRKGLEFLMSTVDSADDVLSWVDYLALPTDGWDGNVEPPTVDAFSSEPQVTALPMSFMFNQAHAQTGAVIRRVAKEALGKALTQVAKQMTKGEAKNLPDALKIVRKELPDLDIKDFRKFVHSPSALKSSVWLLTGAGARSLRNFVRGKNNARYSMPVILATMAYLGWESACGLVIDGEAETVEGETPLTPQDLKCDLGKLAGFNGQVREKVVRKALQVFGDTLVNADWTEELPDNETGVNKTLSSGGHGAMFHLVQAAYFQLQHRFAAGDPIKFMEKQRWVTIQKDEIGDGTNIQTTCGKKDSNCFFKRRRNVDIILGNGQVTNTNGTYTQAGADESETWIELKSWAAQGETPEQRIKFALEKNPKVGKLTSWIVNGTKGDNNWTTHQQFSLDRTAKTIGYGWLPKSEANTPTGIIKQQKVGQFKWRFQAFKVKKKNSDDIREISPKLGGAGMKESFRALVHKRPDVKGNNDFKEQDVQSFSFGSDALAFENNVNLAKATDLVTLMVKAGFNEISQLTDLDVDID